jgi:hypothetical protein
VHQQRGEEFFLLDAARSFFKHARNLADEAEANGVTAEKRKLWGYFLPEKMGRRRERTSVSREFKIIGWRMLERAR